MENIVVYFKVLYQHWHRKYRGLFQSTLSASAWKISWPISKYSINIGMENIVAYFKVLYQHWHEKYRDLFQSTLSAMAWKF